VWPNAIETYRRWVLPLGGSTLVDGGDKGLLRTLVVAGSTAIDARWTRDH
jgi:hypothetical protein